MYQQDMEYKSSRDFLRLIAVGLQVNEWHNAER